MAFPFKYTIIRIYRCTWHLFPPHNQRFHYIVTQHAHNPKWLGDLFNFDPVHSKCFCPRWPAFGPTHSF
ncbi:hypothetical protein PAXRUDRAFT_210162 [Paxillus rubicundulus Ve08.2h10]|uniref:Uncharacterized protein n=1 Tax=Paxillus rubicundulus Ve08.2h10 TaxID=930991 RepID=A0A0D0CZB0_9AGAM|nr:hypothetical protein PAXRUDRAFT_210162 [Paxillus rubicundulus Ve08.2h10]